LCFAGVVKGDTPMLVKAGGPAPNFQLKDETGKVRTLAEFAARM